ncbi:hypothetical protein AX15_004760 [Amanita polypyramis BW_CC]|nr:hypothetical protein AX15_004760 [Amanita polypyramis BW_CC]
MMYSDDDEDLARAIALSLQEAKKPEVVDLVSDDDDHDDARLEHAGRASKETFKSSAIAAGQSLKPDNPMISAFLSERAQLEKERRERQKRMRSQAGLQDSEEETDKRPSKSSRQSSAPVQVSEEEQLFPEGELRQTATQHAEPRNDGCPTFRLTQILGKRSELAFAILSSYSLDWAWIYQFFDPAVPVIMVAQPDATGEATLKYVFPNWIRATVRLPAGRGCMHMKFMLLFYKGGRLRVVVATANLIAYDWRDMENTVWLQDVPLRSSPIPDDPRLTEDFPAVLQRVLHSVNVRPALETMLKDSVSSSLVSTPQFRSSIITCTEFESPD